MTELTLVLPEKADPERDLVAEAWERHHGPVLRIGRFWDPPPLDPDRVRLYGNDTFCLVLAQKLGLHLVRPPDDALLGLPDDARKRVLSSTTLGNAGALPFPAFVKPMVPKLFRAGVFPSSVALAAETDGLAADTMLLVSEVVPFFSELRCWVLDGEIVAIAAYEGSCDLQAACVFAGSIARDPLWPEVFVLDIAEIEGRGFAVVEANAAWGAGLNGCDATAAAQCIARASRPGAPP